MSQLYLMIFVGLCCVVNYAVAQASDPQLQSIIDGCRTSIADSGKFSTPSADQDLALLTCVFPQAGFSKPDNSFDIQKIANFVETPASWTDMNEVISMMEGCEKKSKSSSLSKKIKKFYSCMNHEFEKENKESLSAR